MKRRLFGAVALGCLFVSFAVPVAEGDPSRSAPMQFALRQDAGNCGTKCRTWIAATGMIRAETAREFEIFAARNNLRGATIALNSEGGSVHGAIALGRAIRRLEMTATVGRSVDLPNSGDAAPKIALANLSPKADCESMCAFVLLGGAKRVVPNEARVRVHQIWLGDRRDDAAAATYSAEDLVLVQRDIGKLAQYTMEMGGSIELLEVSLRIPPWEPMRSLTRDEMRRMNLDNSTVADIRPSDPQSTTAAPGSLPVKRIAFGGQRDRERGWTMAERSGTATLTRRHPLTFEGEDLGTFDVTFTCGASANEFLVLYTETRRAADGDEVQPLKSVEVRLGNKIVPLILGPSKSGQNPGERMSSASGVVTAAMLRNFAAVGSRSLTIDTIGGGTEPAVIRIGNTGAAQGFAQFATSCSQPGGRSEHAGLQPAQ